MSVIDDILRREGGYVDHPDDKGGPTNYGITQETLSSWRGMSVTREDVRALSRDEAARIYQRRYIDQPRFSGIDDVDLRELVIDCGVNHGTHRAAKWLQKSAGVTDDGVIGPVTLEAVNGGFPHQLFNRVLAERIRFYGRIITSTPSQSAFAAGWMNRAAEFLA